MKKLLAILLFATSAVSLKAQTNYLLTKTGEKIAIMSDLNLDVNSVGFKVENSAKKDGFEWASYKDKKFKMVQFEDRVFMVLPDGKQENIMEIVCFNDKYILASWYIGGFDLRTKIFDWDFNSITPLKPLRVGKKYQKKDIEERIKPYFGDCPAVLGAMENNIETGKTQIIDNMYAAKCNTKKTINDLIKVFLARPEPTK